MNGIFFTTLLDFLEERFGLPLVDDVLESLPLSTGGAYTAVSEYPYEELLEIIRAVARAASVPPDLLLGEFGESVIGALLERHAPSKYGAESTLDFMETVDRHIHTAVMKRYPDAEVPRLAVHRGPGRGGVIEYHSHRPLADMAAGMVRGCIRHFGDPLRLVVEPAAPPAGCNARFRLETIPAEEAR